MAETGNGRSTTRRQVLRMGGYAVAAIATGYGALKSIEAARKPNPLLVNDVHSRLNGSQVKSVFHPTDFRDLVGFVESSARTKSPMGICGSRHAMGGQQFASGAHLVDTRGLSRVIDLDSAKGIVHTEAGVEWPDLVDYLLQVQPEGGTQWTIPSKQTGADRLTLGGAISANAHGRGLNRPPISGDIDSFVLITASGEPVLCSRESNADLFSLVLGGYGLFGVVYSAKLRLVRREKLERIVETADADHLMAAFEGRIRDGFVAGDWQFAIDERSEGFLQEGVFACYRPVPLDRPFPSRQKEVSDRAWNELVYLAHTDKSRAFHLYRDYYLSTNGQVYWSDTSQLGGYAYNYHHVLDKRMRTERSASEMITELYVPRSRFADFMTAAAKELRRQDASVIYGTVRLIKKDPDSFLAWAREDYACIIFNLHVEHAADRIERAARAFRSLIDLAADRGGSYYLTYHRWATADQLKRCYPQFPEFLRKKAHYDPGELFQSDWYRHYRDLIGSGRA